MKVRRFHRAVHLTGIAALTLSGLLVTFAPSTVNAATFTTVPTRLYMAPAGVSLPNGIAQLVGVKVGTLEFDGSTDPISQDVRSIVVNTLTGNAGCDLTQVPYDIDDCSRVQIGVSHGRLKAGNITTIADGDGNPATTGTGDDVYLLPSGARIDSPYQVAKGSYLLGINGTPEDLNQALADLVYTPDIGYYYDGSNDENVSIALIPGNGDDNLPPDDTTDDIAYATIQIRVLNVNGFPVVTAPGNKQAQAGVELKIPAVDPSVNPPFTGTQITVTDADNDEVVDGAQANPPVDEEALQDGAGSKMLLVGYLDCGVPTTNLVNGFHLRGGAFEANSNDIRAMVRDFFQFTQLPPTGQTIITTLLDGIDAIQPGLTTIPLASNNPTDYTSLFAGIGTMYDVQYALSQITFLQPAAGDTCTVWTAVSDLGNNGLPLQYFGDPPTGIEVPMIGLDLDSFDINTGVLAEIDISFVASSPLFVNESAVPTDVEGQLRISPAIHPEFTIQWEVNPKSGDPEVAGIATAGDDFQGTYNNTLVVPENEEFIPTASVFPDPPNTTVYADAVNEGNETFTFDLVLNQTPPPGYFVTSAIPSRTVVIVDDDDPVRTVSVNDPSVVEGDTLTRSLTFTLTLSGPADGNESVSVATTDGSATLVDGDYVLLAPQVVAFAAGQTQKTVTVTVNGDLFDELGATDETLMLGLSSPLNVTIADASGVGTIENDDLPRSVSISDASKVEGNAATSPLNFTLTLNSPAKGNEMVTVTSTDVTASAGSDYVILTGVPVAFVAGATTATVSVTINGDAAPESNETFTLTLGSPANASIGDGTATGTIQNDDGVPGASIGDIAVTEGNAGTTNAIFTVSLDAPAGQPASVSVVSSNGTATAGGDYTAVGPLTVSFGIGEQSKTVTVLVNGDTEVELTEAFTMTLSNANQLVISDATALGTITNDDVTSSVVSIADATVTEGGAIDQTVISMTNPAGRTCAVTVTSVNGSAVAPADFVALAGATFNLVSLASDLLSLTIVDDPLVEVNETFTINIVLHPSSNAACVLGDAQATITIVSNDLASVISIADATVTEAAAADQAIISMTNPAGHNCAESVTTTNGSATAPSDYSAIPGGTFNLLAVPSGVLSLTIVDDLVPEPSETFTINIVLLPSSNPACVLGDASATILILDDDSPPDVTAPAVTIDQAVGQADPTASSPILFTAVFSEPVIGFGNVAGDVVLGGTSNGTKVATVSGGPTVFTVSVAVTGATNAGTVIASIPAAAAGDGTNASLASTSADNSVLLDKGAPTVTINQAVGQTDPTAVSPVVFAVEFSESVTGFATGDAMLTGTAGATTATVSGSGASYTITVTGMTGAGTVIVTIAAGVAQDALANTNVAATIIDNTVQFDVVAVPFVFTITVPANIVRNNDPGQAGAIVAYPAVTTTGGVAPIVVACDRVSGSFFALGTVTVSCTATDAQGQMQGSAVVSGSFTVRVVDVEPPVIADLPDLTRVVPSLGSVAVSFSNPSATDNSGVPPTVVCSPASGSTFSIGVTTVTCTATDGAGNQASSSFTVTVTSDGLGLGLPATGSTAQPLLTLALFLLGAGLLLVGSRRSRHRML